MWDNNTVEDEIQRNSLEYGVSVNTDRSIPDAKSGLKPVARRIVYDAFIEGRTSDKPHVKCARIVGDVMGRLHPHGDSSIYGALIRLSQSWVMRYPLIDVHGNNGTVLGDGPAAARYTESRLSKIAELGLLSGIKKRNVDFVPNYDDTEEEPETLPAIFPNLLCNPNEGIGWAMGCSWAPHNLREVAAAINDYLDGKEPMLPGPDFPTGGIIINKDDIPNIMRTGHGSVKVRAKYKVEGNNIVFYELPYGTRLEPLMEKIGEVSDGGAVQGIVDIRNETSGKTGLRLTVQVDKNSNPDAIANQLFTKTDLQSSFSYNQVALIGKTPTELNLEGAIKVYCDHNIDCIKREATYDLDKIIARLHILEGLLKALGDIDNIIALIKKSESAAAAKTALMSKYVFTEIQAKAILEMKLAKLANLEKVELQNEQADLAKEAEDLKALVSTQELLVAELRKRLNMIVAKFGDDRRTELTQLTLSKEDKEIETVVPEDVVVIMTEGGEIKRVAAKNFKTQRRNGKGVKTVNDVVLSTIATNTIDTLLLFSNEGKMYRLLVDNVPSGTNVSRGARIGGLINLGNTEKIIAITSLQRKSAPPYICFFTKNGLIKKSNMEEFLSIKKSVGVAAIKLKEGDAIASVGFFGEEDTALVVTHNGHLIHFETCEIAATGRATSGVKAIKLDEDDYVVTGVCDNGTGGLGVFAESGKAKIVPIEDCPLQGRGGKGVYVFKGEKVASVLYLSDSDTVFIAGHPTSICISCSQMAHQSRTATGTPVIKGSTIQSVSKVNMG